MARDDAIIDMARNGFLDLPNTNKDISEKKTIIFHDLPEELQITAIMCEVQENPAIRQSNTDAMDRHRDPKKERYKMVKREGSEKAKDEFIQCIIYRNMQDSDWRWKTAGEVKK